MKKSIAAIFVLIVQCCPGNMASPVTEGTISASALSSRDIDILHEKIELHTDREFSTASYRIEYLIRTGREGRQVPLLFHAKDYKGDFRVWVDNRPVELLGLPIQTAGNPDSLLKGFPDYGLHSKRTTGPDAYTLSWGKGKKEVLPSKDLKYFETELAKGDHQIRVAYDAEAWTDRSDWVKKSGFRYSLSPAKNWKSFGTLEISLDASAPEGTLATNLGAPVKGVPGKGTTTWKFNKLPAEYIEISHHPEIGRLAKTLIGIGPQGITGIIALVLAVFHFRTIRTSGAAHPDRKHNHAQIIGNFLVPLLIIFGYVLSFWLIDRSIGDKASRNHGYVFAAILSYPLLLALYSLAMWLALKVFGDRR